MIRPLHLAATAATSLALAGCASVTHTPPGTSVEIALAKKAELVKPAATETAAGRGGGAVEHVPAVEPPMPQKEQQKEQVADAYSRGVFCLRAEQDDEAIAAFEETIALDPTFSEAWENLAALYEKKGDSKKALDCFKKAKTLARQ